MAAIASKAEATPRRARESFSRSKQSAVFFNRGRAKAIEIVSQLPIEMV
jgi:hypothetical protein